MEYPAKSHYLCFRKKDRCMSYILDYRSRCVYEADIDLVRFLRRLNGRRDPMKIAGVLTREEAVWALEYFEIMGFLEDGKRLRSEQPGIVTWTMMIPEQSRRARSFARAFSRALLFLWLPLLVLGLRSLMQGEYPLVDTGCGAFFGIVNGFVFGSFLRETAAGLACFSYGGEWLETGIEFFWCFPLPYVLINRDLVKGRMRRLQTWAAGSEANLALAGIYLTLLNTGLFDTVMLICAAVLNMILAAVNLSLLDGLDGMGILSELLGVQDLYSRAACAAWNPGAVKKLKERGLSGKATLACLRLILFFNVLTPLAGIMSLITITAVFTG